MYLYTPLGMPVPCSELLFQHRHCLLLVWPGCLPFSCVVCLSVALGDCGPWASVSQWGTGISSGRGCGQELEAGSVYAWLFPAVWLKQGSPKCHIL